MEKLSLSYNVVTTFEEHTYNSLVMYSNAGAPVNSSEPSHVQHYVMSYCMKCSKYYRQLVKRSYFDDGACVCMYSSVFFTMSCLAMRSFSFRPFAFFSMPCAMTQKQSRWTCSSWVCSKSYLTQKHKPHLSQLILNTQNNKGVTSFLMAHQHMEGYLAS